MRVAAIGRTEIMYDTVELLLKNGFEVPLIITSKESPEYRRTAADFEALAKKNNAKYIYTPQINSEEVIKEIRSLGPIDVCVSINYSGIISQHVIDLFPIGILNAHAGDLPRYRGNACQAWAIINGESQIGLCIYKMKGDYLDGGELIRKKYYPLTIDTRVGQVWEWLNADIPDLFLEAVKILKEKPDHFMEDTTKSATKPMRCYPRIPEDGRIDWSLSNIQIIRLINASSEPFAGAYCEFSGKKMIIWRAQILEDGEEYLAIPGQVSAIRGDGAIEVIAGKGKIVVTEIEFNGTRTSKPAEVIKSIRNRFN